MRRNTAALSTSSNFNKDFNKDFSDFNQKNLNFNILPTDNEISYFQINNNI